MAWVGPSPESTESFGIKHTARDLATKAGVPIVPGTQGLIDSAEDAIKESEKLGFPVMLKATAGGGGMGLAIAHDAKEVKDSFAMVKSRGENLFKNAGMFIERFYPDSHHVEVQVFGNGQGKAIHFGERECSIQRRHQKVIEECPSPFVVEHPREPMFFRFHAKVLTRSRPKGGSLLRSRSSRRVHKLWLSRHNRIFSR